MTAREWRKWGQQLALEPYRDAPGTPLVDPLAEADDIAQQAVWGTAGGVGGQRPWRCTGFRRGSPIVSHKPPRIKRVRYQGPGEARVAGRLAIVVLSDAHEKLHLVITCVLGATRQRRRFIGCATPWR